MFRSYELSPYFLFSIHYCLWVSWLFSPVRDFLAVVCSLVELLVSLTLSPFPISILCSLFYSDATLCDKARIWDTKYVLSLLRCSFYFYKNTLLAVNSLTAPNVFLPISLLLAILYYFNFEKICLITIYRYTLIWRK